MLERYPTVMITGGAGFIGSHLCEEIESYVRRCVVIDDLSTGDVGNVPEFVDFFQMNLVELDRLTNAMKGVDLVFHLAAQPSTRDSISDPDLDFRSNTLGTYNVLKAAHKAGVRRFVYTSSSAVYGEPEKLPLTESDVPVPGTPYGASKLCGEHYCSAFHHVYGLTCTCLRPFNVYGPRENLETSLDEVAHYTAAVMEDRPITVFGDGSQTRDFVYVKDVARAHLLAADNDASIGKVINIGTGGEITINELIATIENVTGNKARIQPEDWPEGDISREYGDISQAKEILGYVPQTDLIEGIGQMVKSMPVAKH